jgi:hypothetical protein
MKTIGNQGFLTISNATGRIVSVKTPSAFQIANKINGFEQISCGTALTLIKDLLRKKSPLKAQAFRSAVGPTSRERRARMN